MGRGAWDFVISVSRESNVFHTSGRSKICLYIHEVKDTCIRDLKKNKCVLRVTGNPVKKVR